jgi:tetratricopeptide (TPR) repeat protein
MIDAGELDAARLFSTDGEIAVINLESARRRSWTRFLQDPMREGLAETVLENEMLTAQFIGDVSALDRLEALADQLAELEVASARTALIRARVASMLHRFADARRLLVQAKLRGAAADELQGLEMTIDQACGVNLDELAEKRREIAERHNRLEDLVGLGALLADLGDYSAADFAYRRALRVYADVSPFPIAWIFFQLGVLWGELLPEPDAARTAHWYRKALECLPGYTKARVHLAEVHMSCGRSGDAEALLIPALASGDPEVCWRLADVLAYQGKLVEAETQLEAARSGYECLLGKHRLAFADHAAEFYSGSGDNFGRALELARINVANRPTLRALEQAHAIAVSAGDSTAGVELLAAAEERWGGTLAFQRSPLANRRLETWKGAAA